MRLIPHLHHSRSRSRPPRDCEIKSAALFLAPRRAALRCADADVEYDFPRSSVPPCLRPSRRVAPRRAARLSSGVRARLRLRLRASASASASASSSASASACALRVRTSCVALRPAASRRATPSPSRNQSTIQSNPIQSTSHIASRSHVPSPPIPSPSAPRRAAPSRCRCPR
jgi:hypothetical protein